MTFDIPILLLTFNRPNHTQKVFDEIKKQRPKYLYIFQDGAREGNKTDLVKCAAVRAIFENPLDWNCELKTYYSDKNLGCGKGPASGISWFFENVEKGIILEDDAVPSFQFFEYAKELLLKYENNEKIKVIGSMHIDGKQYGDGSYHFTMMNRNLCAWATWKRTWNDFDYFLDSVSIDSLKKAMKNYRVTRTEINYWCNRLEEIHKDRLEESSWDMQLLMVIWLSNGVGICPNKNLSTNIGFDEEGTHTHSSTNIAANLPTNSILPLVHPRKIEISRKADLNYHKLYFQPHAYGWIGFKRIPYRINRRIKEIFGIKGSWIK